MTTRFTYLFDPLCGWCYGASDGIAALAAEPGVIVDPLPVGLFAGPNARTLSGDMAAHILASDRQIETLTGATFGAAYRDCVVGGGGDIRLDSSVATLALTAVALTTPAREREALGVIQRARYVDGRDVTDPVVVRKLLAAAGLAPAAQALADGAPAVLDRNRERLDRARALMQRLAIRGVPALLREDGDASVPVDAGRLYDNPRALLAAPGVA